MLEAAGAQPAAIAEHPPLRLAGERAGVEPANAGRPAGDAPKLEPALLRDRESAALCSIARSTFLALVRDGRAPRPVRLGSATRWRRAELLDWIEAGCLPLHKFRWRPK